MNRRPLAYGVRLLYRFLKNLTEKDSSLPHEIKIYEAIRLRSSKQAVFSRKELLLQDAPMRYMPWILRVSSIAALFLGIWFSLPLFNQPDAHYVTATLESDNFIEWIDKSRHSIQMIFLMLLMATMM